MVGRCQLVLDAGVLGAKGMRARHRQPRFLHILNIRGSWSLFTLGDESQTEGFSNSKYFRQRWTLLAIKLSLRLWYSLWKVPDQCFQIQIQICKDLTHSLKTEFLSQNPEWALLYFSPTSCQGLLLFSVPGPYLGSLWLWGIGLSHLVPGASNQPFSWLSLHFQWPSSQTDKD